MRTAVQERIDEIANLIDRLRAAAVTAVEEINTGRERHEEMQKEQWRQRKELATLSRSGEEIAGLQDRNSRLQSQVEALRDSLQALLGNVKSLRNEYRL